MRWVAAALVVAGTVRIGGLGWHQVTAAGDVLASLDPVAIAAVVALEAAWAFTLAQTSRSAVLAVGGRLTHAHALRISMAGFTVSRVIPGGGAAGGLFALRELTRLGHGVSMAATALAAAWATSVISLGVLVLGGLALAAWVGDTPTTPAVSAVAALVALAGIGAAVLAALCVPSLRRRLVAFVDRRPRLPFTDAAARHLNELAEVACDRRGLRHSFGWAAAAWLCDALALWLVFAACGYPLSPTALLVGYASANLLNSAPELTPGWLGVFEAALAATYIALGVPAGTAVAAVLVYRLLSFWLPVIAGIAPAIRSLVSARAPSGRSSVAVAGRVTA